jgi:hypothetical protein
MNPVDAYHFIVEVTGKIEADRVTHGKIELSLLTLRKLLPQNQTIQNSGTLAKPAPQGAQSPVPPPATANVPAAPVKEVLDSDKALA